MFHRSKKSKSESDNIIEENNSNIEGLKSLSSGKTNDSRLLFICMRVVHSIENFIKNPQVIEDVAKKLKALNHNLRLTSDDQEQTAIKLYNIINQKVFTSILSLDLQDIDLQIYDEIVDIIKRLLSSFLSSEQILANALENDPRSKYSIILFFQQYIDSFLPLQYCLKVKKQFLATYLTRLVDIYKKFPMYILDYLKEFPSITSLPLFSMLEQMYFSRLDVTTAETCFLSLLDVPDPSEFSIQFKIIENGQLCKNINNLIIIQFEEESRNLAIHFNFIAEIIAKIIPDNIRLEQYHLLICTFSKLLSEGEESKQILCLEILTCLVKVENIQPILSEVFETLEFDILITSLYTEGHVTLILQFFEAVARSKHRNQLFCSDVAIPINEVKGIDEKVLDTYRIMSMITSNEHQQEVIEIYSSMLLGTKIEAICDNWLIYDSSKIIPKIINEVIVHFFENSVEANRLLLSVIRELGSYSEEGTILSHLSIDCIQINNSTISLTINDLYERIRKFNIGILDKKMKKYDTLKSLQHQFENNLQFIDESEVSNNSLFRYLILEYYFCACIQRKMIQYSKSFI